MKSGIINSIFGVHHLYDATLPIRCISSIFGLTTVSCVKKKNNEVQVSNLKRLYLVFLISIFTLLLIYVLTYESGVTSTYKIGIFNVGFIFQLLGNIASVYVILLATLFTGDKLKNSMKNILLVDAVITKFFKKVDYTKHFFMEILGVIVTIFVLIIEYLSEIHLMDANVIDQPSPYVFLLGVCSFTLIFLVEIEFVMLVALVYERFLFINNEVKIIVKNSYVNSKMITSSYERIFYRELDQTRKDGLKEIELLMDIHDTMNDIGDRINSAFTVQLLVSLGVQFLSEVFTLFHTYYYSLILHNYLATSISLYWSIVTGLILIATTFICDLTTNTAKDTGSEIHKILLEPDLNVPLREKLIVFSQQILHRQLGFSACGLFPIDNTLLFTIGGAAATYLLVMLQFQEGTNAQCEIIKANKTM